MKHRKKSYHHLNTLKSSFFFKSFSGIFPFSNHKFHILNDAVILLVRPRQAQTLHAHSHTPLLSLDFSTRETLQPGSLYSQHPRWHTAFRSSLRSPRWRFDSGLLGMPLWRIWFPDEPDPPGCHGNKEQLCLPIFFVTSFATVCYIKCIIHLIWNWFKYSGPYLNMLKATPDIRPPLK